MAKSCIATLIGQTSKTTVEVHSGPGISRSLVMQAPKGATGLEVLNVQPDERGSSRFNKVYQWVQLQFADGRTGWVRDDQVDIVGDCRFVGYRVLRQRVSAFSQTRNESRNPDPPNETRGAPRNATRNPGDHSEDITKRDLCKATISGIADLPFVRVRSGPGTNNAEQFQVDKGTANILVTEVKPDTQGATKDGKVHQWLNLTFHDGRTGWVRDDLVSIQGDCEFLGYDTLARPVVAFDVGHDTPLVITRNGHTTTRTKPPTTVNTDSPCKGRVVTSVPAKVRGGASTNHPILAELPHGTQVGIFDVGPEEGGGSFRWVQVEVGGKRGWMREDLLAWEGDCDRYNLRPAATDLFPVPMKQFTWVQGFSNFHKGWDVSQMGRPVFSAPVRAKVLRAHRCPKCEQPPGPAFRHHGIPLHDETQLKNSDWGWGFGHHVIVRYENSTLPPSARQYLANRGRSGAHVFALYGHLQRLNVNTGQDLNGETQIGLCGDSGNSTGPHLHLEVRSGTNPNMGRWLSNELEDPAFLFKQP